MKLHQLTKPERNNNQLSFTENHPEQAPTRHRPVHEGNLASVTVVICLFQDDRNHGIWIQLQSPAAATWLRHFSDASRRWKQRTTLRLRVVTSQLCKQITRNCVIAPIGCRHRTIVSPLSQNELIHLYLLNKETTKVFIGGRHDCVDMCSTL